jgi:hypothetical protein
VVYVLTGGKVIKKTQSGNGRIPPTTHILTTIYTVAVVRTNACFLTLFADIQPSN